MASGIKHIEIAVSDLGQSLDFYGKLFAILGWQRGKTNNFEIDDVSVYLKKWDFPKGRTLGARHICFWGADRAMIDSVGEYVKRAGVEMIRGPLVVPEYSPEYYTVDFYDPDGYMLEVAHTPPKK